MDRIRQQSAGSYILSVPTTDPQTGAVVTVTAPVTVTILGCDGQQVYSGAPTIAAGVLTATVPVASLASLDTYSVVWTGTASGVASSWTTRVELCGGHLFETAELRAWFAEFCDPTKFSEATLRAARVSAEQRFERACRVAFVPRGGRWSGYAKGYPMPIGYGIGYDAGNVRLDLRVNRLRRVRSVALDGAAMAQSDLSNLRVFEWGAIDRAPGDYWLNGQFVEVAYEHGYDFPPGPVSTATMLLARDYLVRSALASRATVEATDVGFFRLSVAGPGRPTGIPEVDTVIAEFGRRRPHAT